MYREAEIGCRSGWKQDFWEPLPDLSEIPEEQPIAADPHRAAAWIDRGPRLSMEPIPLRDERPALNDDDLLNPRGTRNSREAMRRAREARRRELNAASHREPSDQPILRNVPAGEDGVIDERPAPLPPERAPLIPPVSATEVRRHVEDARRRPDYDAAISISFNEDDDRFARPTEPYDPVAEALDRVERQSEAIAAERDYGVTPAEAPAVEAEPAWDDHGLFDDEPLLETGADYEITASGEQGSDWQVAADDRQRGGFDTRWAQEAPWAEDDVLLEPVRQSKPRRRGLLGSLWRRREAAASGEVPQQYDAAEWDAPIEPNQPMAFAEASEPEVRSGFDRELPPLPYASDEEAGEDYLLADAAYIERTDDDLELSRIPRVCSTCRYLRPTENGPTCGAIYAQTYRRIIDPERLSCASSIGAWWLPSDEYWESRADITHHGDPTPLLDHYDIQLEERNEDDDLHTTQG